MPATPFLGELILFAGNFAPRGYAMCNGQLLSISQNPALFSLLGTNYGGNGTTTFGLPDLRGRLSVHQGQGQGLSPYNIGQVGGVENHALTSGEAPGHTHAVNANNNGSTGGTNVPSTGVLLGAPYAVEANDPAVPIYSTDAPSATLASAMVGPAGGSQPHTNVMPFLALNWCIALEGIFPARN